MFRADDGWRQMVLEIRSRSIEHRAFEIKNVTNRGFYIVSLRIDLFQALHLSIMYFKIICKLVITHPPG